MYGKTNIVAGLAVFVLIVTGPFWLSLATQGAAVRPDPVLPAGRTKCVESAEYMRSSHMDLLNQWRDRVVRKGQRKYVATDGAEYVISFTETCLGCHTNKREFCDRCHGFVAVTPTCWNCHLEPMEADHGQ